MREHYADEAPRVVVLCDRRPSMSVFAEGWPWLVKPDAIRHAVTLIGSSATAARGLLGYFDEAEGDAYWHPPRSSHVFGSTGARAARSERRRTRCGAAFATSPSTSATSRQEPSSSSCRTSSSHPRETSGSAPSNGASRSSRSIVQDPIWEQSFPDVSGVVVPYVEPDGSSVSLAALTEREARELRETNERRCGGPPPRAPRARPGSRASSTPTSRGTSLSSFLGWADQRLFTRGRA